MTEGTEPRSGSAQDLARRMERIEHRQDDQAKQIADLSNAVAQVGQNVAHQNQLYERDFKSLNEGMARLGTQFTNFSNRMESLLTGETTTAQGREMLDAYRKFKDSTETRLDEQDVRNGKLDLIGRLVYALVVLNAAAIVGFIAWLATGHHL